MVEFDNLDQLIKVGGELLAKNPEDWILRNALEYLADHRAMLEGAGL